MKRINILFLILTIGWMSTIFCFSSHNGAESTKDSHYVGNLIAHIFVPDFNDWSKDQQQQLIEKIDHPIRKCAHAFEYAILGILVYCISVEKEKRWIRIAWLICILMACTDEFHQLFSDGRMGQLKDVVLDSIGSLSGIVLMYLLKAKKLLFKKPG